MAIIKIDNKNSKPETKKITLEFNNGELNAIQEILRQYNFVDEQALMRFAFFILLETEDNAIYIKKNGSKVQIEPSEKTVNIPTTKGK
ncbi:hypothetical protein ACFLZ0_01200 [Patescibacteria group bacterium]